VKEGRIIFLARGVLSGRKSPALGRDENVSDCERGNCGAGIVREIGFDDRRMKIRFLI
jgi:hypothetical protein